MSSTNHIPAYLTRVLPRPIAGAISSARAPTSARRCASIGPCCTSPARGGAGRSSRTRASARTTSRRIATPSRASTARCGRRARGTAATRSFDGTRGGISSGASTSMFTLVPIRPRTRCARHFLEDILDFLSRRVFLIRTPPAFNPDTPRPLSTPLLTPFNSAPTSPRMDNYPRPSAATARSGTGSGARRARARRRSARCATSSARCWLKWARGGW